ncbi:MAG: hypothetical protein WC636_07265 [Candidatus Margulisiibacteriota bacterium]
MFKPQRLIYRETTNGDPQYTFKSPLLQGTQRVVTESFPNALAVVAQYPGQVVRETADALDDVIEGSRRAVKGVTETMWAGGVETVGRNILWDDLGAMPRKLVAGEIDAVTNMTWNTGKLLVHGQGKDAAKSFFWHGIGGALTTPFKALWNGVKGLRNLIPDVVMGGAQTLKHITGLKPDEEQGLTPIEHGIVPAVPSLFKGLVKLVGAPFGKLKGFFKNHYHRLDTSVGWGKGSSSPKSDHAPISTPTTAAVPATTQRTSAFGAKGVAHAPAESDHGQAAHAAPQATAALATAQQEVQTAATQPDSTPGVVHGHRAKPKTHETGGHGHHGEAASKAHAPHAAPAVGNAPVASATPQAPAATNTPTANTSTNLAA